MRWLVGWLVVLCALAGAQEGQKPPPVPPPGDGKGQEKRITLPDWPPKHEDDRFGPNREWMVRTQIASRDIIDPLVLDAMKAVPRHRFVPSGLRGRAYEDRPLPIGHDQTISQPYIVASMTEELKVKRGMKVLEIGTGSGYQAAVLAQITPWVYTIEIKEPLHVRAKGNLKRLGYKTVRARHGDGYYGWPEAAPFDAIIVTAAAPHVPPPLVKQLKKGGRMILPVGAPFAVQDLRLVRKDKEGRVRTRSLYAVRFVPLTGSLGKKAKRKKDKKDKKAKPD
jgi:protein-L-isoaspartate(D-aspartate) O-methyltransferase